MGSKIQKYIGNTSMCKENLKKKFAGIGKEKV